MIEVVSRPRTTDFAFMRQMNDQVGSISSSSNNNSERSATVTDLQSYLGEATSYPTQALYNISTLYNNFNHELTSPQVLLGPCQDGSMASNIISQVEAADEAPVSTDFQFPDIPQALLEQAPEYEYSAHTRLNVFAEGLPEEHPSLTFGPSASNGYRLPQHMIYDGTWHQGDSGSATVESAAATMSYLERGQSTPSSTSLLHSEPGSVAPHYAAFQDFEQLSEYAGIDTNQAMQPRESFPTMPSYDGYHHVFPKSSSEGKLGYGTPRSDALFPGDHAHSATFAFSQQSSTNPGTAVHEEVLRKSPSVVNTAHVEGLANKRMRAVSSSVAAYSNVASQITSPSVRQIYSSPVYPVQALQLSGAQGQASAYDMSPSTSQLASLSSAYIAKPRAHGPDSRVKDDESKQQTSSRDSDHKTTMGSYSPSDWSDRPMSHVIPMTSSMSGPPFHPFYVTSSYDSGDRSRRPLLACSGQRSDPAAESDRNHDPSISSKSGDVRTTSPRQGQRKRKSSSGAVGEDSFDDDDLDDLRDVPPPNPRAVMLAQAATTRQSGTQAQQDCLQALNEAMSQSLEQDGVARCPFPNCTKTFAKHRSYNLKTHLRSHSQLKPFACSSCPRAFSRKHDLERHARVHSGDRPYLCEVCRRGFPRSDALRRHWRVEKECGDRSAEADANVCSAPSSTPSHSSKVAAMVTLPFTEKGRATVDGDPQVHKMTVLQPDLRYPGGGGELKGPPESFDQRQPFTSSSGMLLPNGKRIREGW